MKFFADSLDYWTQEQVETVFFGNEEKELVLLITGTADEPGHYVEWNDQSNTCSNCIEKISLSPEELQVEFHADSAKVIGESAVTIEFKHDAVVYQEIEQRLKSIFGKKLQIKKGKPAAPAAPARDYSKIKILDLSRKKIKVLPDYVREMTELEIVWLEYNPQLDLEQAFDLLGQFPHIKELKFTSADNIPESLGKMSALEQLYISDLEAPAALPESISNLKSLKSLTILSNSEIALPESFAELTALEELNIRATRWNLPTRFYQLAGLKRLDFSNCSNAHIPSEIESMKALESIIFMEPSPVDFSKALPHVARIPQLRALELSVNPLPNEVGLCRQIEELTIGYVGSPEQPLELPPGLFELTQLRELVLCLDYIKEVPEGIGQLESLTFLSFNESTFPALPDSIGRLSNLESLIVSGNPALKSLPETLGNLSKLRSLGVRELPLQPVLPASLKNIQDLRIIGDS